MRMLPFAISQHLSKGGSLTPASRPVKRFGPRQDRVPFNRARAQGRGALANSIRCRRNT